MFSTEWSRWNDENYKTSCNLRKASAISLLIDNTRSIFKMRNIQTIREIGAKYGILVNRSLCVVQYKLSEQQKKLVAKKIRSDIASNVEVAKPVYSFLFTKSSQNFNIKILILHFDLLNGL